MIAVLLVLALLDSSAFAKKKQSPVRITVHPRTLDDALKPFSKPPKKCVPRASKPMTERQKFLLEATKQKDPEEVEQYLRCYATKDYQNYLTKYRPMIDAAAEKFQVDGSLIRCLLLRESQWDSSKVSCTCAMGLGQQTGQNLEGMKNTVRATLSDQAWTDYMHQMRQSDPNFSKSCTGKFERSAEEKNTHSAFYRSIMAHQDPKCQKLKEPCQVYRQDDRRCPAASIAASAAYLKFIDAIVRKAVNCGQIEQWQIPDSRIALALAYNAGEGTAKKALARANDENETISINFLDGAVVSKQKLDELRHHYRALRMCLHEGETEPPAELDKRNPNCFAPAQQQVNGQTVR